MKVKLILTMDSEILRIYIGTHGKLLFSLLENINGANVTQNVKLDDYLRRDLFLR